MHSDPAPPRRSLTGHLPMSPGRRHLSDLTLEPPVLHDFLHRDHGRSLATLSALQHSELPAAPAWWAATEGRGAGTWGQHLTELGRSRVLQQLMHPFPLSAPGQVVMTIIVAFILEAFVFRMNYSRKNQDSEGLCKLPWPEPSHCSCAWCPAVWLSSPAVWLSSCPGFWQFSVSVWFICYISHVH